MKRSYLICTVLLIVLGILLIIIGALLVALLDVLIKMMVKQQVPLKPGGYTEQLWKNPPYDVRMQFWVFHLQNPMQVTYAGATPMFEELGPFTYREVQKKRNVTWNDNGTVTYMNFKWYYYSEEESCRKCASDALVTVPNIPYFTALNMIRSTRFSSSYSMQLVFSVAMEFLLGEEPFARNIKVNELLYEGYADPLFGILSTVVNFLHIPMPTLKPRVGLFYGQNGTNDGIYNIDTGVNDVNNIGVIRWWNYNESLDYWNVVTPDNPPGVSLEYENVTNPTPVVEPNFQANMINGTDGTIYHPFLKKTDTLRIFVSNICRSVFATSYEPEPDVTIKGIPAYRYSVPDAVFNAENPSNAGYAFNQTDGYFRDGCGDTPWFHNDSTKYILPSGFLNVSYGPLTNCERDKTGKTPAVPLVMSSPKFLYCPECAAVQLGLDPLTPNISEPYYTFLDIEPITGAGLRFARRLQVNVPMFSDPNVPNLKNFKPAVFPVAWLNESAVVDDKTASSIHTKVVLSKKMVRIGGWVAIGVGLLCLSLVAIGFITVRYRWFLELHGVWPIQDSDDLEPIVT